MDGELDSSYFDKAAIIAKSLGNNRRIKILELLSHGEYSVENIANSLNVGITSVSAHLQTLKNSGIIVSHKEGVKVFYKLADKSIAILLDHIKNITTKLSLPHLKDAEKATENTTIALHDLLKAIDTQTCTIIDVRPKNEYDTSHIPGALSVPVDDVSSWAGNYAGDKNVVIYCRGIYCLLSATAMRILENNGITCYIYRNGISEWRNAGFPMEQAA